MSTAPSTDRRRKTTTADVLPPPGIDTIAVRGPVDPDCIRSLRVQRVRRVVDFITGEIAEFETSGQDLLPGDVTLIVDQRFGPAEGRIELSVPKLLNGHNATSVSLQEAMQVVRDLHRHADRMVGWLCNADDLRVTRVDVVRDFADVPDAGLLLTMLAFVPVQRMSRRSAYMDARGQTQCLYRGNLDRFLTRVYRKDVQMRGQARHAPEPERSHVQAMAEQYDGTVRYEAEIKGKALREQSIGTVGAMAEQPLAKMSRSYFDRAALGTAVGGRSKIAEAALLLQATNRYRELAGVIALLVAEAHHQPPPMSPGTTRKYRNIADSLGLTAADFMFPDGVRMRLDYEQGKAVEL